MGCVLGDHGHVDGNGARSVADSYGRETCLDYRAPDNQWALCFVGGWQEGDVPLLYAHRSQGATQLHLAMEGSPTAFAVRAAGGSRGGVRIDASSEFSIGNRWAISGNPGATQADKEGQIDCSLRLSYRF